LKTKNIAQQTLDVSQAFDKVWHPGLPLKIKLCPTKTTIATHVPTTKLHTTLPDWHQYKILVRDKLTNTMKLKTHEDTETASSEITDILQHAVKTATPIQPQPTKAQYLPSHIKQLVAQKRKARARWQKTHTPDDKRKFNNAINKLRDALRKLNNGAFSAYIASLRSEDQTIWETDQIQKKAADPAPTNPCKHKPSKPLG